MPGDELQCLVVGGKTLLLAHIGQAVLDVLRLDAVELQPLAAGQDGLGHPLRVGGAQDEHDVGRRLLKGLEQGVECLRREHVDLVDDVDLETPLGGGEGDAVDNLVAHVVHAGAGGRVQLVDVGVAALGNLAALLAGAVGVGRGAVLAQKGLGQQAGRGGLAGAARAAEEIGVGLAPLGQGVAQGGDDVLLAHHVGKGLRAVLAVERLHAATPLVRVPLV